MAGDAFPDELVVEAWGFLKELIRIDTTNPPGNELEAIRLTERLLKKEGFEPVVFESAPNRGNLVLRFGPSSGEAKLLLHGHLDVVEADASAWTHDPFAADEVDGILYGRGAVDMKSAVVCQLFALIALKRRGREPKSPIVLACTSDEEAGCTYGSKWLVENQPDVVRSEYAVSEAGGFRMTVDGSHLYPVQVAEKGQVWVKLRFAGPAGHGSSPKFDTAIEKMARACVKLSSVPFEYRVTPAAKAFIEGFAAHMESPIRRRIFSLLTNPLFGPRILRTLVSDPEQKSALFAVLHDTASPTVVRAGAKENVVPPTAELDVDGRILPGQTVERFVEALRGVVGDAEVEVVRSMPSLQAPADDPILREMERALTSEDATAEVLPFLMPGFTDAKFFSRVVEKCYGFAPMLFVEGDKFAELAHGNDERIPFDGFKFGLRVMSRFVSEIAGVADESDV